MDPVGTATIDFAETAYDLALGRSKWLPKLLQAGAPVIDHGLGVCALTCIRDQKALVIDQVHIANTRPGFLEALGRATQDVPVEFLWKVSRPTVPKTLSEASEEDASGFNDVMRHFEHAKDGLGISSFDPNGLGVYIVAPLAERTTLSHKARERWQMLAAHFGAGHRLRRALLEAQSKSEPVTELPHNAEAVVDPKGFRVTDAAGEAKSSESVGVLRDAAVQIDRARGRLRRSDPEEALRIWKALIRGRWSLVDWFDSDGRRFALAVPNAPRVRDPRGLTNREIQVVECVAAGHTNKMISYHLGVSNSRVSTLIGSVMRKLGVRTRAQLVRRWHDFDSVRSA